MFDPKKPPEPDKMDSDLAAAMRKKRGVIQGTFGVIQGTFGVIQGTFGVIQGMFGVIQGTFGVIQGMFGVIQGTFGVIQVNKENKHTIMFHIIYIYSGNVLYLFSNSTLCTLSTHNVEHRVTNNRQQVCGMCTE
jgi:hypothetical protein